MREERDLAEWLAATDAAIPRPRVRVPNAAELERLRMHRCAWRAALGLGLLLLTGTAFNLRPPASARPAPGTELDLEALRRRVASLQAELRSVRIELARNPLPGAVVVDYAVERGAMSSVVLARRLGGEFGDTNAARHTLRQVVDLHPGTASARFARHLLETKELKDGR